MEGWATKQGRQHDQQESANKRTTDLHDWLHTLEQEQPAQPGQNTYDVEIA